MRAVLCAALIGLTASAAMAELRPVQRPDRVPEGVERRVVVSTYLAPVVSKRPMLRPGGEPNGETSVAAAAVVQKPRGLGALIRDALSGPAKDEAGIRRSARPAFRPANLKKAIAAVRSGALCGRPSIKGTQIARVHGKGACGIANPIRVTEVAGVRLSTAATINCKTATALETWINTGLKPAVGNYGGGATSIRVVASYACRTRNSRKGAKLSEHATGNAIDIAGIGLARGGEIKLLTDWNKRREGAMLRKMWRAACGPFGTVLGPESNRFHLDHFHFDVAKYRRPYCR